MQTDISTLQTLPEAETDIEPWPCTVSGMEDEDDDE
jgi:hypothetical protein